VLPSAADASGHEAGFFAGIDTSLPGLAARMGEEEKKVPFLRSELAEVEKQIHLASVAAEADSENAASPLLAALNKLNDIHHRISSAELSANSKAALISSLEEKSDLCAHAINLAFNVSLDATTASSPISPGQTVAVKVLLRNGSKRAVSVNRLALDMPQGWTSTPSESSASRTSHLVLPGGELTEDFRVTVSSSAASNRPYWHREDPATESVNTVDDRRYSTLPFPPAQLFATASYSVATEANEIHTAVLAPFQDDQGAKRIWPVPVVPKFSVAVEPATQLSRIDGEHAFPVKVRVESKVVGDGVLRLRSPANSRVEPEKIAVQFGTQGGSQEFSFEVFSNVQAESKTPVRAVLTSEGREYSDSYTVITREDLGAHYYFQPATQKVSFVEVRVPTNLRVGYIMGAGDEIPSSLQQLGIALELIPATSLEHADLSRFSTIVLGIRVYDTQKELIAGNKRLLDYVSNGGTLIVQYNSAVGDFNSGKFTPYPLQLSRARVSVEEAPVQILTPNDSIFHYPNEIAQKDFDGWVQERGLYFAESWDPKFTPLLACNDPGEALQKGGLLRAQFGKGVYIYTGYAFFRQLPAGVPGAVRLYVNLLSAGHEPTHHTP
jgi:hypothetical protein